MPMIDGCRGDAERPHLPELVLYFREGCHLCEDMEQQLRELLEPDSYRLRCIDIDQDAALRISCNARVPLLCLVPESAGHQLSSLVPGESPQNVSTGSTLVELCEHFLDLKAVRDALASYNRGFPSACDSPARW
ncbi:MAG: glutaredoxin family protein [Granulosicoccus sp.]|nr:glutaredoxin family protein [Granulosicoccus sp.]